MEIFNSNRCLGLGFLASAFACMAICSCTSDEEYQLPQKEPSAIIKLENGESIELEDTITHTLDEDSELLCVQGSSTTKSNVFDMPKTRAISGSSLRAYGYDSLEPESGWKKYLLNKWDVMYGVYPGLYIGRYVKVHKNLSIVKGCYASPANYNKDTAPKTAMGWDSRDEKSIGFGSTNKSDYIADGVTRIFVIFACVAKG